MPCQSFRHTLIFWTYRKERIWADCQLTHHRNEASARTPLQITVLLPASGSIMCYEHCISWSRAWSKVSTQPGPLNNLFWPDSFILGVMKALMKGIVYALLQCWFMLTTKLITLRSKVTVSDPKDISPFPKIDAGVPKDIPPLIVENLSCAVHMFVWPLACFLPNFKTKAKANRKSFVSLTASLYCYQLQNAVCFCSCVRYLLKSKGVAMVYKKACIQAW